MSTLPWDGLGPGDHQTKKQKLAGEPGQRVPKLPRNTSPAMETAFFSPASLFHGDDSDDGRDEMQVDAEGEKQALEYVERVHKFPGMELSIREFSSHQLNANLLWPGTFLFADWLVKNRSILDGQRILELGSGTGALAIFLRKAFGVDITTSDYDDKEIEENIAYNCRANNLDLLPHIRHTWGEPFPVFRPDWDIVIASDILLLPKPRKNTIFSFERIQAKRSECWLYNHHNQIRNSSAYEVSHVSDELAQKNRQGPISFLRSM